MGYSIKPTYKWVLCGWPVGWKLAQLIKHLNPIKTLLFLLSLSSSLHSLYDSTSITTTATITSATAITSITSARPKPPPIYTSLTHLNLSYSPQNNLNQIKIWQQQQQCQKSKTTQYQNQLIYHQQPLKPQAFSHPTAALTRTPNSNSPISRWFLTLFNVHFPQRHPPFESLPPATMSPTNNSSWHKIPIKNP